MTFMELPNPGCTSPSAQCSWRGEGYHGAPRREPFASQTIFFRVNPQSFELRIEGEAPLGLDRGPRINSSPARDWFILPGIRGVIEPARAWGDVWLSIHTVYHVDVGPVGGS